MDPSSAPSNSPSQPPTQAPINSPSRVPTISPTYSPSMAPSIVPTSAPTNIYCDEIIQTKDTYKLCKFFVSNNITFAGIDDIYYGHQYCKNYCHCQNFSRYVKC